MSQTIPDAIVLWALEKCLSENAGDFPELSGMFEIDALIQVKGKVIIDLRGGMCNEDLPGYSAPSKVINTQLDLEVVVVQSVQPKQIESLVS